MRKAGQARRMRLHSVTKQKMAEFCFELYFRVAFISLLLSLASGDCVDLDLGMENGTILDEKITASSENNTAKNGRLNSGSSWCAGTSDSNPYLQIDLQTLHIICAVSTQGNSQADEWVKTYTLLSSIDGSSWTNYKEDGVVKTFAGNIDRNSEVKHVLYGVLTRYLRFLPTTHQSRVCMRTEAFGVKTKPVNLAFGRATDQSSTNNYNSTVRGVSGNAVDGYPDTDFGSGHCSRTNAANPSWWRVDLGANLVPVSDVFIVNSNEQQGNKDYKITLGSSSDVTKNKACEGLYSLVDFQASAICFTNPRTTGRYVGIMTTKSQVLQLCEVEVYSRENLAFGKPTYQHQGTYKDGKSSKAVDGNSNTDFRGGAPEGSCSQTQRTNKPWWRVDLQQVELVSEVYIVNRGSECGCPDRFKNFEIRVGTESSGTSLANPTCGGTYTYSLQVGKGTSFFCHPSLKGRFVIIRILKPNTPLTLCEVEVYSQRRACPMQAIGVASKDAFPDNRFSALSGGNTASNGRLNGAGAWSPSNNSDANDYLQIDLLYEFVICAVATQGNPNADHWTTKYKLQLALMDNDWIPYQEDDIIKVFNGNSGKNDTVKHSLKEYASARFIRFQPTAYSGRKALRVEVFGILISAVPSQAPGNFTVAATLSTSITVSWQLPPKYGRHGIITGFKLFYRKKDSAGSPTVRTNNVTSLTRVVSGLDAYTGYEFQVLAFSSKGDGPKSSIVVETTKEDAPSIPTSLTYAVQDQENSHGPRINLTWSIPAKPNGIIRNYTVFYSYNENSQREISGIDALSYLIDVVGGATYQFHVRAVTIKPGPNATLTVNVPEYVPSHGPENVSSTEVNNTSFQITWATMPEKVAHGVIRMYQVRLFLKENCTSTQEKLYSRLNTTTTNVVLSGLSICAKYEVSVRGYTVVGPGPYSRPIMLQTLGVKWSKNAPSSSSFPWNSTEAGFTAKITLPRFPANAKFFQVIIIKISSHYSGVVDPPESFSPQDLVTYDEAHESLVPAAYVTFQFSGNDFDVYQEFIVGNEAQSNSRTRSKRSCDDYRQYYNKPLQPNTGYRVFLRAFVTEVLYITSNFVEIKIKEKPAVKKLPEKSILSVGELVLLTCEVTGDPEPSVTWSKNGNSSIPRAQFKNDGRILIIKDVLPGDRGVYECKASNKFGESRTSTTLIVAVPPRIAKEVSPPSVICERQTLCTLSCHATSGSHFNYSWTKNGQVLVSDDIKIMNNIIVLTPRGTEDYGVYVCHATNSFGSTAYKITVSDGHKYSTSPGGNSVFQATTITFSFVVFVLLVVNLVLIWRLRRAVPNNRKTTASIADRVGQSDSPRDQYVSEPDSYMELRSRPPEGKLSAPLEYTGLQCIDSNPDYYNVGIDEKKKRDGQEDIYYEVRDT